MRGASDGDASIRELFAKRGAGARLGESTDSDNHARREVRNRRTKGSITCGEKRRAFMARELVGREVSTRRFEKRKRAVVRDEKPRE